MRRECREQVAVAPAQGAQRELVVAPRALTSSCARSQWPARRSPAASSLVRVATHFIDEGTKRSCQLGACSWSQSTGVSDTVSGAPESSTSSSGR